ncbi:MAG TPA: T9SS type A sorting domain-containing protein, partial [Chitinophagaceae bacterium]
IKNESPVIEMGITVYPNPVKDVLNVRANSGPATLKLYDASGRLVKQQQMNGKAVQQITLGYLKNGLYLLKIENATGVTTKKIVIQN